MRTGASRWRSTDSLVVARLGLFLPALFAAGLFLHSLAAPRTTIGPIRTAAGADLVEGPRGARQGSEGDER